MPPSIKLIRSSNLNIENIFGVLSSREQTRSICSNQTLTHNNVTQHLPMHHHPLETHYNSIMGCWFTLALSCCWGEKTTLVEKRENNFSLLEKKANGLVEYN